jgi:hypothetical protein
MEMRSRFTAGLLALTMGASLFGVTTLPARAGSSGRKNFALGLGAVAAYELLRGKTGTGLLAAAGAAYAYKRYSDARRSERLFQFPHQFTSSGYAGGGGYSGGAANNGLYLSRARAAYRGGRRGLYPRRWR